MYIFPALKEFGCRLLLITYRSNLCDFTGILYHKLLYLQYSIRSSFNHPHTCQSREICFAILKSRLFLFLFSLLKSYMYLKSYILSRICRLWSIIFWPCKLKKNKWMNWTTIPTAYLITSRMLSDCSVISNAINNYITLISRTFSLWINLIVFPKYIFSNIAN